MTGAKPVFGAPRTGDEMRVTYRRDEIRTVRFGDAAQETTAPPAGDGRLPTAGRLARGPLPETPAVRWLRPGDPNGRNATYGYDTP